MSYVKKIPVVCTMGCSKDFAITRYMTELSSVKVVTLTLGHPVDAQMRPNTSILTFQLYYSDVEHELREQVNE